MLLLFVDTVRRVVDQIIQHGWVVRPTLGVNVAGDRIVRSTGMQLGRRLELVVVVDVLPGSAAERAGIIPTVLRRDGTLALGDLIVEVDGRNTEEVEDLLTAIEERRDGAERKANEKVEVRVLRSCDLSRPETLIAKLDAGEGGSKAQGRRGYAGRSGVVGGRPE